MKKEINANEVVIDAERASLRPNNSILMQKVLRILEKTFHGLHHVHGKLHEDEGFMIYLNVRDSLATYDFNQLTTLVIGAHEECVRLQINYSGPHMLKLYFWNREREGSMSQRHPTIEQAVKMYRGEDLNNL